VVNAGKEFFNIAFQYPAGFGVVFADFKGNRTKPIQRFVSSFANSAGKRIGDKDFIKKRVKFAVNGVMNQPVPHARFVDISRLGVGNIKGLIAAVFIGMMNQVLMQRYYIVHQVKGKFLNVFFLSLPFQKLLPSLKQIIQTDNIFKTMSQLDFHKNFTSNTPPPPVQLKFNSKTGSNLQIMARFLGSFSEKFALYSRGKNRFFVFRSD